MSGEQEEQLIAEATLVFAMHVAWVRRHEGEYKGDLTRDARKFVREYVALAADESEPSR